MMVAPTCCCGLVEDSSRLFREWYSEENEHTETGSHDQEAAVTSKGLSHERYLRKRNVIAAADSEIPV